MDIENMREAVNHFQSSAKPSNASSNAECTVGDINDVIKAAAKMMNAIIDEIESSN